MSRGCCCFCLRPIVSWGTQAYGWDALRGGVFLREPSPYLRQFRRKPRKTPKGQVYKRDRGLNLALPVYQFSERRTVQPLLGPRTDNLTSMPYPGFKMSRSKRLPEKEIVKIEALRERKVSIKSIHKEFKRFRHVIQTCL